MAWCALSFLKLWPNHSFVVASWSLTLFLEMDGMVVRNEMDGSIIRQVLVLFLEVDPSKILDPIVGGEPTRVKSIQLQKS